MTRNNYREIQVALRKPHILRVPYAPAYVTTLTEAELIAIVYHSCQEFNEYWGSPYNICMDFLDHVVVPTVCGLSYISEEDGTLPF